MDAVLPAILGLRQTTALPAFSMPTPFRCNGDTHS